MGIRLFSDPDDEIAIPIQAAPFETDLKGSEDWQTILRSGVAGSGIYPLPWNAATITLARNRWAYTVIWFHAVRQFYGAV